MKKEKFMEVYSLVRCRGAWVLRRSEAKRALINFKNKAYGNDFNRVLSAVMTYADGMWALYIHDESGRVIQKLDRAFIHLYLGKK